ncbi:MAG: UvrD-helicase domain-containing protein, partial [Ruminococcaceae bacterium]|nr:UvrD-helicase domain-containing protein [Oscillospiraceae bacterium]
MGLNEQFIELRKRYIESRFSRLNDVQREAAFCVKGPLLILAGAGSGKTMVLVNRTRYIIEFGNAYHSNFLAHDVSEAELEALQLAVEEKRTYPQELAPLMKTDSVPVWSILAITFTNKAAAQLKESICRATG